MSNKQQELKQQAAEYAVNFIEPGMVVGLGTGSTAILAVRHIAKLLDAGKLTNIVGISTSIRIEEAARELGIPLTTLEEQPIVDLTIDGADEVDPMLDVIKGGGGALLREKIVAQASKRQIIIVDESKPSDALGTKWAVPIEVIPFGWGSQRAFLASICNMVTLRQTDAGEIFKTDHGNLILDCDFGPIQDTASLARQLNYRTGIVEHGLFLDLVTDVIIAGENGIEHKERISQKQ